MKKQDLNHCFKNAPFLSWAHGTDGQTDKQTTALLNFGKKVKFSHSRY